MNDEHAFYGKFIALSKEAQENMDKMSESQLAAYCHLLTAALFQTEDIIKEHFEKSTSDIIMETYGKKE